MAGSVGQWSPTEEEMRQRARRLHFGDWGPGLRLEVSLSWELGKGRAARACRAECQGGEGGQKASSGDLQRSPVKSSAEHHQRIHTGVSCHGLLQGNLPNPGIEHTLLKSPALAGEFLATSATWEAQTTTPLCNNWHICVTPRCVRSLFSRNDSRAEDFSVGIIYLLKSLLRTVSPNTFKVATLPLCPLTSIER